MSLQTASPYFTDDSVTLHLGRAVDVLATLPAGSVDCVVTSPPYWRQRDYGIEGQQGMEPTVGTFVDGLVQVFRQVWRVLADDGTVWVNLGDGYSGHSDAARAKAHRRDRASVLPVRVNSTDVAPRKSMLMTPERVALALIDDGWILRNRIIWQKTNGQRESVRDRFTNTYESVFFFTKSQQYFFDLDAVKVPAKGKIGGKSKKYANIGRKTGGHPRSTLDQAFETRNPGDVWNLATAHFPGEHFAVMPEALAQRCVIAGCTRGG